MNCETITCAYKRGGLHRQKNLRYIRIPLFSAALMTGLPDLHDRAISQQFLFSFTPTSSLGWPASHLVSFTLLRSHERMVSLVLSGSGVARVSTAQGRRFKLMLQFSRHYAARKPLMWFFPLLYAQC